MRSKNNVPVGQGCKRIKDGKDKASHFMAGRCACHPHLHLNLCKGCFEFFHSPMPHSRTCSDRCRKRLSRSKNDRMLQLVLTYATGS